MGADRSLAFGGIHLYNVPTVVMQVEMLAARAFAEASADSDEAKEDLADG